MNRIIEEANWTSFLKEYSSKNEGRPTRLGIFEQDDGRVEDLWIEDGLPLIGVDLYRNKDAMRIDILFEGYGHAVEDVVGVLEYSNGDDAGLDVIEKSGRTTILRFEHRREVRG